MTDTWTWTADQSPSPLRPNGGRTGWRAQLAGLCSRARERVDEGIGGVRGKRARSVLLEGEAEGGPLRCLYLGTGDDQEYVESLLFGRPGEPHREELGFVWDVPRWFRRHRAEADVVVVDLPWPHPRFLGRERWIITPAWVNQSLALGQEWKDTFNQFRGDARRNDLKRVKKHGLRAELTRSPERIRHFYDRMYIPYVRRRFGGSGATLESFDDVAKTCRQSGLLQVFHHDRAVAGMALEGRGAALRNLWIGLDPSVEGQLVSATLGAVYYYSVVLAHERGFHVLDLCGSRSTLRDGVLRYKRKWGARVHEAPSRALAFSLGGRPAPRQSGAAHAASASARAFFAQHAFLESHAAGLRARVLHPTGVLGVPELEALVEHHEAPGLSELWVHAGEGVTDEARQWSRGRTGVRVTDLTQPGRRELTPFG